MPRQPVEDDSDDSDISLDDEQIKNLTLPEPEPIQIKINALLRVYAAGQIELNPYYQRDVVWPEKRQSGLINSIFNNYYIPPVIFQCRRVEADPAQIAKGKKTNLHRTAIDGKQRLSSIIAFRNGQIPYRDFQGHAWWYPCAESKNKRGKMLTEEMRTKFDGWSLLCIEYNGLNPTQEEELFSRVQQGMSLTNSERQMAGHTPWIKMLKDLMKQYNDVVHLCDDLKRGKDFGYTANVCIMIFYRLRLDPGETLALKTQSSLTDKIVKAQTEGEPTAKYKRRIQKTFAVWAELVEESPETFTNRFTTQMLRKFSPIEFITTGVLIEMYMDTRDNATLIQDIYEMRKFIRTGGRVIDLRTNQQTWGHLWEYIIERVPRRPSQRPHARRATPPPLQSDPQTGPRVLPNQVQHLAAAIEVSNTEPKIARKRPASQTMRPVSQSRNDRTNEIQIEMQPRSQTVTPVNGVTQSSHTLSNPTQPPPPQPQTQANGTTQLESSDSDDDDEIFKRQPNQPPPQQAQFPQFPPEYMAMWAQAAQEAQRNGGGQTPMFMPSFPQPFQYPGGFPGQFPGQFPQFQPWQANGFGFPAFQTDPSTPQHQKSPNRAEEPMSKRKRIKLGLDDE